MNATRKSTTKFEVVTTDTRAVIETGISKNADQFRDVFYVLHNIDKSDLEAARVITPGANGGSDWTRFNNDIGTFVIKLRQENLEALFELVRSRIPA